MFSLAVDYDWLSENPFFKAKKFSREENKTKKVISLQEEILFLKSSEKTFVRPMFLFSLYGGLRMGEIRLIKWKHVDLEQGHIEILKTKSGVPRQVPIAPILLEELKKISILSEYVFTNPKTLKPYTRNAPYQKIVDICNSIGLKDITPHCLRHSSATRMGEIGVDPVTMLDIFGWSTLKMVQRYSHSVAKKKKEAINDLNNYSKRKA